MKEKSFYIGKAQSLLDELNKLDILQKKGLMADDYVTLFKVVNQVKSDFEALLKSIDPDFPFLELFSEKTPNKDYLKKHISSFINFWDNLF